MEKRTAIYKGWNGWQPGMKWTTEAIALAIILVARWLLGAFGLELPPMPPQVEIALAGLIMLAVHYWKGETKIRIQNE